MKVQWPQTKSKSHRDQQNPKRGTHPFKLPETSNSRESPAPGQSRKRAFICEERKNKVVNSENKDIRARNDDKICSSATRSTVEDACTKMKLGCWNGAEAATQDFQRIVNVVAAELELKKNWM